MSASKICVLSSEQALFDLTILNAEQASREFEDVFLAGIRSGLPPELLTRLKALWDETRVIAGEVILIGKVIINEIAKFLRANPQLTAGLAIGAAVGVLVSGIPILGPLLAPIATLLSALYGAGTGAAMQAGDHSGSPFAASAALATKFFELFMAILNAVAAHWSTSR